MSASAASIRASIILMYACYRLRGDAYALRAAADIARRQTLLPEGQALLRELDRWLDRPGNGGRRLARALDVFAHGTEGERAALIAGRLPDFDDARPSLRRVDDPGATSPAAAGAPAAAGDLFGWGRP